MVANKIALSGISICRKANLSKPLLSNYPTRLNHDRLSSQFRGDAKFSKVSELSLTLTTSISLYYQPILDLTRTSNCQSARLGNLFQVIAGDFPDEVDDLIGD